MREPPPSAQLARRHVALGLWALLVFITLGATLEALHAFKADAYLNVENDARRLLWRLAHAHGTLLAILHLVFGLLLGSGYFQESSKLRIASGALRAALVLLPGGFFLGGVATRGGDPGPFVLLVPPGAICLFAAVLLAALSLRREATTKSHLEGPSD